MVFWESFASFCQKPNTFFDLYCTEQLSLLTLCGPRCDNNKQDANKQIYFVNFQVLTGVEQLFSDPALLLLWKRIWDIYVPTGSIGQTKRNTFYWRWFFFHRKRLHTCMKNWFLEKKNCFHGFMSVSLCSKLHVVLAKTISFVVDT